MATVAVPTSRGLDEACEVLLSELSAWVGVCTGNLAGVVTAVLEPVMAHFGVDA